MTLPQKSTETTGSGALAPQNLEPQTQILEPQTQNYRPQSNPEKNYRPQSNPEKKL